MIDFIRYASPNETRCIATHNQGFYNNIVVGATYIIPSKLLQGSSLRQFEQYTTALIHCVRTHAFLSATLKDADTNKPGYSRSDQLNIKGRIRFHRAEDLVSQGNPDSDDELVLRKLLLERLCNNPRLRFSDVASLPPWTLDVLPLSNHSEQSSSRVFISFTYSHSICDGMSGIAFHQTFLEGLQKSLQPDQSFPKTTIETPSIPLPDPPDTVAKIPISLSYLLRPALGTYLPSFLTRPFGITGNVSGTDDHTWTGPQTFTEDTIPDIKSTTNIELFSFAADTITRLLRLCKTKNVKLTALLDLITAQALLSVLKTSNTNLSQYNNFVSAIPINLRKALSVPSATIGNYGGGSYLRYDLSTVEFSLTDIPWPLLETHGKHLATVASTTRNQPIGLLRYVFNFKQWLHGQIGHARSCSWELSNLGSFDAGESVSLGGDETSRVKVEGMLFSQPASPIGPPLGVNVAAVKGGALTICVVWQPGAFGVELGGGDGKNDDRYIYREIVTVMKRKLEDLAQSME